MADFFNQLLAYIQVSSPAGNYSMTLGTVLALVGTSILMSAAIMGIYIFTHRKMCYRASMAITIMIIGPIVSVIVLGVGSNLARAISIGGGLALIRFRNTVGDPKDIIYMYLSVASGLACGIGYWAFALVAVVMILLVLIILNLLKVDEGDKKVLKLKITVPESLNYVGVFDDVLKNYCKFYNLSSVKTVDYGTLLELSYMVRLKDLNNQKEMIDKLREKNGNLNIALVQNFEAMQ